MRFHVLFGSDIPRADSQPRLTDNQQSTNIGIDANETMSTSPSLEKCENGPILVSKSQEETVARKRDTRGSSSVSTYDWPMTSTEKLMDKYAYKADLIQFTRRMDAVLSLLANGKRENILQALKVISQIVSEAWRMESCAELVPALCAYLQQKGDIDLLINLFISDQYNLRVESGEVLEGYLSSGACSHLVQGGYVIEFVRAIINKCDKKSDVSMRLSVGLLETLFRHGPETCQAIVDNGGLDFLIDICKCHMDVEILAHTAAALSNLAIFGGPDMHKLMVGKHVPLWLFVLASHKDRRIKYYGCLAFCAIASSPDIERSVKECDTMALVRSFLRLYDPDDVTKLDEKYRSGRSLQYLAALAPMLNSTTPEVSAMATFQLAMEASLRKGTNKMSVFDQLGFKNRISEVASTPGYELGSRFAVQLLNVMGEVAPPKLSQTVPLWTAKDVQFWLQKVGYSQYAERFARHRVDGDLLLQTTNDHLRDEVGMSSAYERMRFIRELNSLKRSADYSTIDRSRLDSWLISLDVELSVYTYQMLLKGVDRPTLIHLNDEMLNAVCGIWNSVHRWKILRAVRDVKHEADLDLALLRKKVDIFISYRRATGSQLASLLKASEFQVFIDVDRLYAGQFDKDILMNVRAAKHFIIVLTQCSLDPCINDDQCQDWVHLELKTALEAGANIIPVTEKGFKWPPAEILPADIRALCGFNAIQWVHDYQQACIDKLNKYLTETSTTITTLRKKSNADDMGDG